MRHTCHLVSRRWPGLIHIRANAGPKGRHRGAKHRAGKAMGQVTKAFYRNDLPEGIQEKEQRFEAPRSRMEAPIRNNAVCKPAA